MGERKVLNKYYPPDFDPAKLPRGKRDQNNRMTVRMMLPMSIRCGTCSNFMYKGTKFNSRKEDAVGETYLGIQIFRFYFRCSACAAEVTMKTDPKNSDYVMEHGASRNYEPWRAEDLAEDDYKREREEEERGNAMKALENRTLDSKREMDLMTALDEMRSLNARHAKVTTESALEALKRSSEVEPVEGEDDLDEADEAMMRSFLEQKSAVVRLEDDEAGPSGSGGGSGSGGQLFSPPEPVAKPAAPKKAAAKVVPKPTIVVKRKVQEPSVDAKKAKVESEPELGALGALGAYGSDESSE